MKYDSFIILFTKNVLMCPMLCIKYCSSKLDGSLALMWNLQKVLQKNLKGSQASLLCSNCLFKLLPSRFCMTISSGDSHFFRFCPNFDPQKYLLIGVHLSGHSDKKLTSRALNHCSVSAQTGVHDVLHTFYSENICEKNQFLWTFITNWAKIQKFNIILVSRHTFWMKYVEVTTWQSLPYHLLFDDCPLYCISTPLV